MPTLVGTLPARGALSQQRSRPAQAVRAYATNFGQQWREQDNSERALFAARTDTPPTLDGDFKDAAWKSAPALHLEATGRGGPAEGKTTPIELRAAYDGEALYVLLRWRDATKDDTHKSYIWNEAESAYEVAPDREDNAALAFPIRGEFTANMLSGKDQLWDVWHWKAARTGPGGYAMDRTHLFSVTKPAGKAKSFPSKDGQEIWIARPEDAGESVTRQNPAPSAKQDRPPVHYEPVKSTDSASDIRTGQAYRDGWWTVEFARKLNTGHGDDAAFSLPGSYAMGVAVFDKSEHDHHYTAGPITLEVSGAIR